MSEITEEIRKELEEYDALMQKHPEWKGMHGKFPDWLRTLLEENERLIKERDEHEAIVKHKLKVKQDAVDETMTENQQLREELSEEKRHAALGWEQSNKWLEENGSLRAELDRVKRERDDKVAAWRTARNEWKVEAESLRTELAEKDKVLEWIRDDGTDYQSIQKAREVLSQFKKGESTNEDA